MYYPNNIKMTDILVIGSCNTDIIWYAPKLPSAGETIKGSKQTLGCGGKGGNQCVAAAKLGAKTAIIGKVGNDVFGETYRKQLKSHRVNIKHLKVVDDVATGTAGIVVADNGENNIVIATGANDLLCKEDILEAEELISQSKVVLFQFETPLDTTLFALKICKKYSNCQAIINASPVIEGKENELLDVLKLSDVFCVNEIEAEAITRLRVKTINEAKEAGKVLRNLGGKLIIITMGPQGCVYVSKESIQHIPVAPVDHPLDTSGAGDSFLGSFAFFYTKFSNCTLEDIIRRSNFVARESVLKLGTQCSYPLVTELNPELFQSKPFEPEISS